MPRQRKDKLKSKEDALQDIQQDHENFLLAFEKPTQIYRFLRARQAICPTFMHRNLMYMPERCSRTNARRSFFCLEDLLTVALASQGEREDTRMSGDGDIQISFIGITTDTALLQNELKGNVKKLKRVDVEVLLSKVMYNKRKDSYLPVQQLSQGVVEVPVNPPGCDDIFTLPCDKNDALLTISAADLGRRCFDGSHVRSISLLLRIREVTSESDSSEDSDDWDFDEDKISVKEEGGCPPIKKKKVEEKEEAEDPAGISLKNLTSGPRRSRGKGKLYKSGEKERRAARLKGQEEDLGEEIIIQKRQKQRVRNYGSCKPPLLKKNAKLSKAVMYEAEMLVYNSSHDCQAGDGEYELLLHKHKVGAPGDYKRKAVWESFSGGREIQAYNTFSGPCIKLQLRWLPASNPGPLAHVGQRLDEIEREIVLSKMLYKMPESCNHRHNIIMKAGKTEYRKSKLGLKTKVSNGLCNAGEHDAGIPGKVCYQFMYNNNTQQQTESRDDFYCPWCQLNCMTLYGLMKHLKLCHPRFLFRYSQQPCGTNIIVSVNECYDGSYAGNPQNIFVQPGLAFSHRGPVQRTPVTDVLVYKPHGRSVRQNCNLANLLDKEDVEAMEAGQFSGGHRRLYFHSGTVQPIRSCEFDNDSDGESEEPDWLLGHTKRMIDEFTDVNEGEKALMKLWNLHVMRFSCISDSQIESECRRFVKKNIMLLSLHNLRKNLLLHFLCLVDFGVFKTSNVIALMDYYDEVLQNEKDGFAGDAPNIISQDFPEPDLLPQINKLRKIVTKT